MLRSLLPLLCLLPAVSTVTAETLIVRPDGSGDYPTIQAAIHAARDGDVIKLTDGTYTGNGNRDIDFLGKAIIVGSQRGDPQTCVIDCNGYMDNPHRGFIFQSGEGTSSRLVGITVRDGYAYDAGGMLCANGSQPVIERCVLLSNRAYDWEGGGALAASGSRPTFSDCSFVGNRALFIGGGLSVARESSAKLYGCEFVGNISFGFGAALAVGSDDCSIIDSCSFRDNGHEGVVVLSGNDYIVRSEFVDNASSALVVYGPRIRVERCSFRGNTTDGDGAALQCFGPAQVVACDFSENVACCGGAIMVGDAAPTFMQCTLANNSASVSGSALACYCNTGPILDRCLLAFGRGPAVHCMESESTPELNCCDVFGNSGGDWVGCIGDQYGVNGNFSADPLFCMVSPGEQVPPFHLHADSPCLPGNHPHGYDCGLIGAYGKGCGATTEGGKAGSIATDSSSEGCRNALGVFPNPTYGDNSISMALPVESLDGEVSLRVHDAAGRLIRMLAEGQGPMTQRMITWDGKDRFGRLVPSGVYFLRLSGVGETVTKRVMVTK